MTNWKHGHTSGYTRTLVYAAWQGMLARCGNEKNPACKNYGGRGIKVCAEWRRNFKAFFHHVGFPPTKHHSIDRIDNMRGYEPGNVQWSTSKQQCRNRRSSRILEYKDKSLTVAEWAEVLGMREGSIRRRLALGWSAERALSEGITDRIGEKCVTSILRDDLIREIRASYGRGGVSQRSLGDKYGVSQAAISKICRGVMWKHV